MDGERYDVSVLQTPFEVLGVQLYCAVLPTQQQQQQQQQASQGKNNNNNNRSINKYECSTHEMSSSLAAASMTTMSDGSTLPYNAVATRVTSATRHTTGVAGVRALALSRRSLVVHSSAPSLSNSYLATPLAAAAAAAPRTRADSIDLSRSDAAGNNNNKNSSMSNSNNNNNNKSSSNSDATLAAAGRPDGSASSTRSNNNNNNSVEQQSTTTLLCTRHKRGKLLVWDSDTCRLLGSCTHSAHVDVVQCVSTPQYLYTRVQCTRSGDDDDTHVFVWSATTFVLVCVLRGHDSRVTAMAAQPRKLRLLATAALDRYICVWNVAQTTKEPLHRLRPRHGSVVTCLSWHGDFVLAGGSHVTLEVWHGASGQCVAHTGGHNNNNSSNNNNNNNVSSSTLSLSMSSNGGAVSAMRVLALPAPPATSASAPSTGAAAAAAAGSGAREATSSGNDVTAAAAVASLLRVHVFTGMADGSVSEWTFARTRARADNNSNNNSNNNGSGQLGSHAARYMNNSNNAEAKTAAPPTTTTTTAASTATLCISERCYRKPHRAMVSDIVADAEVLLTSSLYDGACVQHRGGVSSSATAATAATATTATTTTTAGSHGAMSCRLLDEGEGCCAMVLDSANRRIVLGSSRGRLLVYSYAAYAAGASREVVLQWCCRPHASALTGLFLVVTHGSAWARLVTCSMDHTITRFDFVPTAAAVTATTAAAAAAAASVQTTSVPLHGSVEVLALDVDDDDDDGDDNVVTACPRRHVVVAALASDGKSNSSSSSSDSVDSGEGGAVVHIRDVCRIDTAQAALCAAATADAAATRAAARTTAELTMRAPVAALRWCARAGVLLVVQADGNVSAYAQPRCHRRRRSSDDGNGCRQDNNDDVDVTVRRRNDSGSVDESTTPTPTATTTTTTTTATATPTPAATPTPRASIEQSDEWHVVHSWQLAHAVNERALSVLHVSDVCDGATGADEVVSLCLGDPHRTSLQQPCEGVVVLSLRGGTRSATWAASMAVLPCAGAARALCLPLRSRAGPSCTLPRRASTSYAYNNSNSSAAAAVSVDGDGVEAVVVCLVAVQKHTGGVDLLRCSRLVQPSAATATAAAATIVQHRPPSMTSGGSAGRGGASLTPYSNKGSNNNSKDKSSIAVDAGAHDDDDGEQQRHAVLQLSFAGSVLPSSTAQEQNAFYYNNNGGGGGGAAVWPGDEHNMDSVRGSSASHQGGYADDGSGGGALALFACGTDALSPPAQSTTALTVGADGGSGSGGGGGAVVYLADADGGAAVRRALVNVHGEVRACEALRHPSTKHGSHYSNNNSSSNAAAASAPGVVTQLCAIGQGGIAVVVVRARSAHAEAWSPSGELLCVIGYEGAVTYVSMSAAAAAGAAMTGAASRRWSGRPTTMTTTTSPATAAAASMQQQQQQRQQAMMLLLPNYDNKRDVSAVAVSGATAPQPPLYGGGADAFAGVMASAAAAAGGGGGGNVAAGRTTNTSAGHGSVVARSYLSSAPQQTMTTYASHAADERSNNANMPSSMPNNNNNGGGDGGRQYNGNASMLSGSGGSGGNSSSSSSWWETSCGAVTCCAVAFCAAGRYVALVYHDGLVQLLDTATQSIFVRAWSMPRVTSRLRVLRVCVLPDMFVLSLATAPSTSSAATATSHTPRSTQHRGGAERRATTAAVLATHMVRPRLLLDSANSTSGQLWQQMQQQQLSLPSAANSVTSPRKTCM